ncbi:MAG: DUF975 family protein [Christensenellaceae bacterium]|nr:DUF975 family protein [Christensenellaceae bacterium]
MRTAAQTRELARQNVTGKWWLAIGVCIIYNLIAWAASALSAVPMLGFISLAVTLFLVPPIFLGYTLFMINLVRRKNPQINDLFGYFKDGYWMSMGVYWLKYVFIVLWSLLLIIPGIIKTYSYAMSEYLVINKIRTDPNEAITFSRELMNGNKWRLFCLHFSFIGWILLGILTLGILFFWIEPYIRAAEIVFFDEIAESAGLIGENVQPTAVERGDMAGPTEVYDGDGFTGQPTAVENQPTIVVDDNDEKES